MNIAEADRTPDPLDLIWIATAHRLGLQICRRADVFASYDGRGTLALGTPQTLDPDDNTAQMILHEICHWIVNGAASRHEIDWGFEPMEGLDWRERPTIRLQLALSQAHDLQAILAPTTAARAYWDALSDPLEPLDSTPDEARVVERARVSLERAQADPWSPALQAALQATAAIACLARPFAVQGTVWVAQDFGVSS